MPHDKLEAFEVYPADPFKRVDLALQDMREGRMVILVDDEDRENEGDLVIAAERCTPEAINFMATYGRGLICLSIMPEQVQRLGLPMMATNNKSLYGTAFTVSIEAREGVTTGISVADRAHTIQVAIAPDARPRDVVTPGHMFPLQAREGGVLERVGQTEGSVDLARLAGLLPAGVICEIMKDDGTMARLPDLMEFGAQHQIRVLAVADIIRYRMRHERIIHREGEGTLDVPGLGTWQIRLYSCPGTLDYHLALYRGELNESPTLARVQPTPPPWTFLQDSAEGRASSAWQSLRVVAEEGRGAVVFMHAGGGLVGNLRRAFAGDFNADLQVDPPPRADQLRDLGAGCQILRDLGLAEIRLLLASERPIVGIEGYGLRLVERISLIGSAN